VQHGNFCLSLFSQYQYGDCRINRRETAMPDDSHIH